MRQIKFRAWDKSNKCMFYPFVSSKLTWYVSEIWMIVCSPYHFGKSFSKTLEIENLELMQFTGLYDKNGKEIWESDLVTDGDSEFEIKWSQSKAGWIAYSDHVMGYGLSESLAKENLIIIGNIWERK